jgi:hypothetical protein
LATVTNLTFNKNTANIVIASHGAGTQRIFAGGALTYNDLTWSENSGHGSCHISGSNTFANLYCNAGNALELVSGTTQTITNPIAFVGTAALPIALQAQGAGSLATISIASGASTLAWAAIRDITFGGGQTCSATNSFDLGGNTGVTVSTPSSGAVPTVADIVAGVWDEPTAGNVTAGTFGAQLKTVLDAVDAKTTNLPSDPADASVVAGLIAAAEAKIDIIDTTADAIKAKTDSLTFTVAGQVDANIKSVAGTTVTGVGSEADPWGP